MPRDLPYRDVAGETVLLDPQGEKILGLNGTGGRIWALLDGKRTIADIATTIADEYGIEVEQALKDVTAFTALLIEKNLATAK